MINNLTRSLGESAFKKTAEGKQIFFPYGVLVKGRIVDSEKTYQRLLSHYTRWSLGGMACVPILAQFHTWLAIAISIALFALAYHFSTWKIIKNLPVANERLSFEEAQANLTLSAFTLWVFVFIGASLLVVAVDLFATAKRSEGAGMAVFGMALIFFAAYALIKKRRRT